MNNDPHPNASEQARQPASLDEEFEEPGQDRSEPFINLPAIVVLVIAICVAVHLVRTYVLTPEQDFELLVRTAFIPIVYSGRFELDIYAFTSPVTYSFLHGGLTHLLLNMVWLAAFGAPLAYRTGAVPFLLFWCVTSAAGAALFYAFQTMGQIPLVGASGAISGLMGAAARFGFRIDRSSGRGVFAGPILPIGAALRLRPVATFLLIWFAINLATALAGLSPDLDASIAWEAHIGGFLVGFLCIGLFTGRSTAQIA